MKATSQRQSTGIRQCPYCGKPAPISSAECPYCHETFSSITTVSWRAPKRGNIRQGLLYMLLAGVIHYFAGPDSGMDLPFSISPMVTRYLTPLLFLCGLGLVFHAFYLRVGR